MTSLYNQVEEKLHTLVMRSNESLQRLEFVFRLREMEAKISAVREFEIRAYLKSKLCKTMRTVFQAETDIVRFYIVSCRPGCGSVQKANRD